MLSTLFPQLKLYTGLHYDPIHLWFNYVFTYTALLLYNLQCGLC